jgi:iron complex transport system ATP-binding protein
VIKVTNLSYNYIGETRAVIDDISVDINTEDITTILGLNGSGKTTLIKLLVNILKPTSGSITINNKNIADMSIKERSKLIAYVPQLIKVDYDFYVHDYLSFSLTNQLDEFRSPSQEHQKKIKEMTNKFKISHLLNKKLNNLSGGERQIIAICGAFIQESPIIILDEPTSALDLKNQSMVIKALKNGRQGSGKTFILSTHNPNHALSLGGDTIILNDNKIYAKGKSREIVTLETLKPIYGDVIDYAKNIPYNVITIKD